VVATARRGGARIVFDIDDLMIDPSLASIEVIDGIRSQALEEAPVRAHDARVQRTMLAADLCTATTEELAQHLRRSATAGRCCSRGSASPRSAIPGI
jgi:hypothetical protein